MNHTDDTPEVVYPEGLVDAIRDLFDQYWLPGVESAVIEMRQMLMSAAEIAALTIVLGDAPANTELVTPAGAEAFARYLFDHGVGVMRT